MTQPTTSRRRRLRAAVTLAALLALGGTDAFARRGGGDDDEGAMKLRLSDAVGRPGGTVALVVRTYAARPIRRGRITVKVRAPAAKLGAAAAQVAQSARPLTFLRAVVFSAGNDAVSTAVPADAAGGQSVRLDFSSKTSGVNAVDGPLAVLFFRLDRAAVPGQRWLVEVDPATTGLVDPAGQPVDVEPISAELFVRAPGAPFGVEAEGDEVEPGERAELGVETAEPFAVAGVRVTLRYDAAAWGAPPVVTIDPRYGKATFRVVRSRPGLLVVTFTSPDASLNSVPGRIVGVELPTSAAVAPGRTGRVWLVPAGTWLLAKNGARRSLRLEDGTLDFE
jgi:hypothetical protein